MKPAHRLSNVKTALDYLNKRKVRHPIQIRLSERRHFSDVLIFDLKQNANELEENTTDIEY